MIRRCPTREGGFTLVEVLIVMTIMPMVVGAIGTAIVTGLKAQSTVSARLADSSGSQLASAYFARDIQSAADVTTKDSASPFPASCGTAGTAGLLLLSMDWNNKATVVSYWRVQVVSGLSTTYQIVRRYCVGSTTPISSHSLATNVLATQPVVAITCSATAVSCASSTGWIQTYGVSGVVLTVQTAATPAFSYQLTAVPRAWNATSGGVAAGGTPPTPPLVVLGSGASTVTLTGPSNALSVKGAIVLNSSTAGAINVSGASSLSSSSGATYIYNCSSTQADGGPCNNSAITSTGTGNTVPVPASMESPIADPYSALALPPNPSATGACTTVSSATTCTPGIYVTPPALPNLQTVTFNPGNYLFEGSTPLSIAGFGTNVILGTGSYLFNGGLSLGGFFNTLQSGAGGVFLFMGKTASAPGNSGTNAAQLNLAGSYNTVSLAPLSTGTYAGAAYDGMLVFENGAESTQVRIDESASYAWTLTGVVYAAGAPVYLGGSTNGVAVGPVVSSTVAVGGSSAAVAIG